jgi:hypothetical protein
MKHFIKKRIFAGAGGKEKPRPKATVLKPPDLGNFSLGTSYSIVDIIDLISDGPIDGLVNQNGKNVSNGSLLQGVYLDNTPVEITNNAGVGSDGSPVSNVIGLIDDDIFNTRIKAFSDRVKGTKTSIFGDSIANCFFNYEAGAAYSKQRRFAGVSFPWLRSNGTDGQIKQVFADYSPDGKWQPVFTDFYGTPPPYYNGGNVISNNLKNEDPYDDYYNQDVHVSQHGYYFKLKDATSNFYAPVSDAGAKAGKSIIEVHYLRKSLSKKQSILMELANYLDSKVASPTTLPLEKKLAEKMKAKILNLWHNYPLGVTEGINKFTTKKGSNTKGEPDPTDGANFSNSTFSADRPSDKFFVIIKIGHNLWQNDSDLEKLYGSWGANKSILADGSTDIIDEFSLKISKLPSEITVHNLIIPKLCEGIGAPKYPGKVNEMSGRFYGCVILEIPLTKFHEAINSKDKTGKQGKFAKWNDNKARFRSHRITRWSYSKAIQDLEDNDHSIQFIRGNGEDSSNYTVTDRKFNYSNVLCEFKSGTEFQQPLKYFNNLNIDFEYGAALYGATRINNSKFVRRLQQDEPIKGKTSTKAAWNEKTAEQTGGPIRLNSDRGDKEGSSDIRKIDSEDPNRTRNFSDWNKEDLFSEDASPIVHTIENPNVTSVYFTLGVSSLSDTIHVDQGGDKGKLKAGDSIPAILAIDVTWGKIQDGIEIKSGSRQYNIIAQIESQTLIDFGRPNVIRADDNAKADYVTSGTTGNGAGTLNTAQSTAFILPLINEGDDISRVKRFIRITKISVETNSVLIRRECSLVKVTEIIDQNLRYPFSSICGLKLDSRSFASVPDRSYDCRLKKVRLPSNYQPLLNGIDQRYISDASKYDGTAQIYNGDWNGSLENIGWTDNPAWILYDLLTSTRYGLGGYLDASQINIWELYKIGRFCDAVDENGRFVGVSDGLRGLEPRYSCNIIFRDNIKVFDAINIVSNLFRGATFFSNSEIHFLDDRPRTPIAFFSNANVKDGFFNYANNRKDQQFNTVEVVYLDRFDNFKTKVEFVEDEANLRKRGVLKTTINTNGVTSRAMARRIGKHIIHQTIKENQSIEFRAGLESLLCRPGDLIVIEDEMKTRETNYGKVLDVNLTNKSLYVENEFSEANYSGKLTVYTPTGYTTMGELKNLASATRYRLASFSIIDDAPSNVYIAKITGSYFFDKYMDGYINDTDPDYFAMYTGFNPTNSGNLFCYYNTGASGWVFSTGKAFSDNDTYDIIISNTGLDKVDDIIRSEDLFYSSGFVYNSAALDKRGSSIPNLSGNMTNIEKLGNGMNGGILNSEISTINYPQITTFNITGFDNQDYGSTLYLNTGDPNINLLQFVKAGSPYRTERTGASDQIYKILSIREESQNEYSIAASKYDTGKYELIEKFTVQDYLPDTYYAGAIKVENYQVDQLPIPHIQKFATGRSTSTSFSLSGAWDEVKAGSGYQVSIYNSLAQFSDAFNVPSDVVRYEFTGLTNLGEWTLSIKSLGNNVNLDSDYSTANVFVLYQGITVFDRPAVSNFTIL